ncbi:MAG: choice-of-anchor Q domain-containing protein [Planctomycetota bacterium]
MRLRQNRKKRRSKFARALRLESLEKRQLLTTFVVDNLLDGPVDQAGDVPGSLRQAIFDANANPGADTIQFESDIAGGTITLNGSELLITDTTVIDASSLTSPITIDADGQSRVFNFQASSGDSTIDGLNITGGTVTGQRFGGGVLFQSTGTLTINNSSFTGNSSGGRGGGVATSNGEIVVSQSTFTGNQGGGGGAIDVDRGEVRIFDSVITGNTAGSGGGVAATFGTIRVTDTEISENTANSGEGGGIFNADGLTTVTGSVIRGNNARVDGGGIRARTGDLTVWDSSILENTTEIFDGGGISKSFGSMAITNSTVAGNAAGRDGGGISTFFIDGTLTVTNSTIADNTAVRDGGGIRHGDAVVLINSTVSGNRSGRDGGGIDTTSGPASIVNSTIVDNETVTRGGGISFGSDGLLRVANSIVAKNTSNDQSDDVSVDPEAEVPQLINHSLIGNADGLDDIIGNVGNLLGTSDNPLDPMLAELADSGGSTQTHELLANSPAIDAGNNSLALDAQLNPLSLDQRGEGFDRVFGGTVDMGAFEATVFEEPSLIVDTTLDIRSDSDNVISLRDAIAFADRLDGENTVTFDPSLAGSTITLAGRELRSESGGDLRIEGLGAESLTIDANGQSRVMSFAGDDRDLTIEGLTLTGGDQVARGGAIDFAGDSLFIESSILRDNRSSSEGGGIFTVEGNVQIVDSILTENRSEDGGALAVTSFFAGNAGRIEIIDSQIIGNRASEDGGGLSSLTNGGGDGQFFITGSVLSGNVSSDDGGGLFSNGGTWTINQSTIHDNRGRFGGGISAFFPLNVIDSTVSGNRATSDGGGISAISNFLLLNSTISGNSSGNRGGGLFANGARRFSIVGSTIVDNTTSNAGGGVSIFRQGGSIDNTIIANNTRGNVANDFDGRGETETYEFNHSLIGNADGIAITGGGNLTGTQANPLDPGLEGLADNGGPTATHALSFGSPAIDAGDNDLAVDAGGNPLTFDQRGTGFDRVIGGTVDIGAFETREFEQASLIVTTNLDVVDPFDQQTSLREAIESADAAVGEDTITFDESLAGTTLTLSGRELQINDSLVIDASTLSSPVTIDADGRSRVLRFPGTTGDLTLDGLSLTGGTVTGNGSGAGINFSSDGTLSITNGRVVGNTSERDAGGISARDADVVIADSTISDNNSGRNGGAVNARFGDVTIIGSTLSGNTAVENGGAIITSNGSVSVFNSTISTNTAGNQGGGIRTLTGDVRLVNSTVFNNRGDDSGGGVLVNDTDTNASILIDNSIVAGNTTGGLASDIVRDPEGTLAINHSLIGSAHNLGAINGNVGNLTGTQANPLDPLLGELADNGGSTQTHALLPGSPAFNAGDDGLAVDFAGNPLDFDQRGESFERILFGNIDIGAFEVQTVLVTTDLDVVDASDGLNSLREAIALADSLPGENTIKFDTSLAGSTITLGGSELTISDSVVIDASELSSHVTIDADGQSRVIRFGSEPVQSPANGNLTLIGLAITGGLTNGGSTADVPGRGAGIFFGSEDTLTILNSNIFGNQSSELGGGVATEFGDIVISGSAIQDNTALNRGGGIANLAGDVIVSGSVISENTSDGRGGGITTFEGDVIVTGSTLAGNSGVFGGGGINTTQGNVILTGSTLSDNVAGVNGGGGAIQTSTGSVTLTNSTISGNQSEREGGGIVTLGGGVTLRNSTVVNNTSSATAGGGVSLGDSARDAALVVENSIVAENTASDLPSDLVRDPEGQLVINHSLIGNADNLGTLDGNAGNLTGTTSNPLDPLLDELADNGGATLTHALRPSSPAINAGDNGLAIDNAGNPLEFDQRGEGFDRIFSSNSLTVDIGAFEAQIPDELVVSTLVDETNNDFTPGDLSLREAIEIANARAGIDSITFAPGLEGTITLVDGELQVSESLEILGPGFDQLTIDGDGQSRVLHYLSTTGDLTVDSLTLTGGRVTRNGGGAGIDSASDGTLSISNSRLVGNISDVGAGGISTRDADVTIRNSTISDNHSGGNGGAVSVRFGDVTIIGSTLSGNTAGGNGGAIITSQGSVSVLNSTISSNTAGDQGGGIRTLAGDIELVNSTVFNNQADVVGGGVLVNDSVINASIRIDNSIVAGNTSAGIASDIVRDPGGVLAINHSLISNTDDLGTIEGNVGNLTGTEADPLDPLLGELADNGGPTQTHALLPGSPAINAGNNDLAINADGNALAFDQRGQGFDRVFDGLVDIGAFETDEPDTAAPTVESIVIADGDDQRSMVHSIAVSFSEVVNVSASDFVLQNTDTGANITPAVSTQVIGGKTVATLTFSGDGIIGGSLADGNYRLSVLDTITDRVGNVLDGDGDGEAGGNATDEFFRLYGDINGDRTVNIVDFLAFRSASGNEELDARFDFNGDGTVNILDFLQFRSRFGTSI